MTTIRHLRVTNFGPFADTQSIELEDETYALVARHRSDPHRSNWLGKSSLLEAIDFALYGSHRHRTEDQWLTDGSIAGGVELVLSNGTSIERARIRGKTTILSVHENGKELKKAEADAAVLRIVGLDRKDFRASCYFEQKSMARIVLARPAPLAEMVMQWFDLEKIQKAEAITRDRLVSVMTKAQGFEQQLQSLESQAADAARIALHDMLGGETISGDYDVMLGQAAEHYGKLEEEKRGALAHLEEKKAKLAEWQRSAREATGFAASRTRGIELAKRVTETPSAVIHSTLQLLRGKQQEVQEVSRSAGAEALQKRQLALGKFDGKCPVAGIACPAKDQINEQTAANAAASKKADVAEAAANAKFAEVVAHVHEAEIHFRHATLEETELARVKEDALRLQPSATFIKTHGQPPDETDLSLQISDVKELHHETIRMKTLVEQAIATRARLKEQIEKTKVHAEAHANAAKTELRAATIFRKAQRRIVERDLANIAAGANAGLAESGIDLSVGFEWSREGSGLADQCEECGTAFPASAKVKRCVRCQAARGAKIVNELRVILSNKSGAADDLAGCAIQLAASAYLFPREGARWATAMLDEPFGALDRTHRRALANHVTTMLPAYGFRQAIIVAHQDDVMGALPRRIEIVSDGKHATLSIGRAISSG